MQPDYCDCDGFHDGSCHEREKIRKEITIQWTMQQHGYILAMRLLPDYELLDEQEKAAIDFFIKQENRHD